MIILDTSALYALLRDRDPARQQVFDILREEDQLVVSPYVVAELDYLFLTRYGIHAELQVLAELSSGNYDLAALSSIDLLTCAGILAKYGEHPIGVADASLVLLADRYRTNRVCTLDRRHFSIMRTMKGERFEVLP